MAVDLSAAGTHAISHIGRLPDELSIEIVRLLDAKPPSQLKIIDEPSVELTCSTSRPLKALSCVSRKWRQLVLPVLFRYARLTLDVDEGESTSFTYLGNKKYHRALLFSLAAVRNFRDFFRRERLGNWEKCSLDILQPFPVDGALPERAPMQPPFPGIESLVIYSPVQITEPELRACNTSASHFNVVSIWQSLFDIANPLSLTILAHPNILAFLLSMEPSSGRGNSFDMPLHIFNCTLLPSRRDGLFHHFLQVATKGYRYSSGGILEALPWETMTLNEGSFLRAYSDYEYHLSRPISIFRSWPTFSNISSFTYIAIFPFGHHIWNCFDRFYLFRGCKSITLRLTPAPGSTILQQPEKMGKADMKDAWMEFTECLTRFALKTAHWPILKEINLGDWEIQLNAEADAAATLGSALGPTWKYCGEGHFVDCHTENSKEA